MVGASMSRDDLKTVIRLFEPSRTKEFEHEFPGMFEKNNFRARQRTIIRVRHFTWAAPSCPG